MMLENTVDFKREKEEKIITEYFYFLYLWIKKL